MRLTIRSKLYGSFTVLVLLMLLLGAVSWRASNKAAESMEEMSQMFDASASSAELMGDMLMVRLKVKEYLLRNTEADYQAYVAARDAFTEDVVTVRGQVAGTSREDEVASIDALFTDYDQAFEAVKVVIEDRNDVFDNRLSVIGPRMASAVEAYQYDLIDEGALENIRLVSQLVNSVFDARLGTVKYRQTADESHATQTLARLQKGLESVDGLVAVETNAGDKQKLEDIRKDIGDYLTNFKRLQALASQRNALVVGQLDVIGPEIAELGVKTFESLKEDSVETQAMANGTIANSVFSIVAAVAFSAVFAMVLAVLIGRSVTRPIAKIVASIKDIAQGEGDLTKRVELKSNDELSELADWFNTFVQKLHDIIAEVSGVTSQVTQASMQIAASSEEMSSGLGQQTEQVMQMSSAIEEMSASVTEVARKCGEAANNAADSGRVAEEGGAVVSKTIQGIQSIRDAVNASASSVQELGKRGDQIGEIIEVINDIADQTNLLALNAAIEAARAGEHGRGFAVVADEVRKLADRTTTATQEIAESITAIQSETSQAVERMNSGSQEVEEGVGYATSAGDSLQQIVAKAHDVADMIGNIAAAAEQQSAASEQISRSIDSITAVSSQSSASSNDAAASAVKLSKQAEQLQQLVGQFKLSV